MRYVTVNGVTHEIPTEDARGRDTAGLVYDLAVTNSSTMQTPTLTGTASATATVTISGGDATVNGTVATIGGVACACTGVAGNDNSTATILANTINNTPAAAALVTALASTNTVGLTAKTSGGTGNLITLSVSGTGVTRSGSYLTGGTDTLSLDCEGLSELISVTLNGNLTIAAPTNMYVGQRLQFYFKQGAVGSNTVTWNAAFTNNWSNTGYAANAKSAITFTWDGTAWLQNEYMPWLFASATDISELIVNVQDYGALGDGSTDDRAAIQNAINALTGAATLYTHPALYFPAGHYKITSLHADGDKQLKITKQQVNTAGLELRGAGRNQVRLTFDAPSTAHGIYVAPEDPVATYYGDLTIRDMEFYSGTSDVNHLVHLKKPSGCLFDHVKFFMSAGGNVACYIDTSLESTFDRCDFGGGDVASVQFSNGPSTSTQFYDCTLSNTHGDVIRGGNINSTNFYGGTIQNAAGAYSGLSLGQYAGDYYGEINFFGTHFENNAQAISAGWTAGGPGDNSDYCIVNLYGCYVTGGSGYAFELGNILGSWVGVQISGNTHYFRVNYGGTARTRKIFIDKTFGAYQQKIITNAGTNNPFTSTDIASTTTYSGAADFTVDLSDAGTGEIITSTISAAITINNPIDWNGSAYNDTGPIPFRRLGFLLTQNGVGGNNITWGSKFKTTYSNTGNAANTRCFIWFVFDGTNWIQESITGWYA